MDFCPQCRSVLLPEKRNDTVSFVCVRCGSMSDRGETTGDSVRPKRGAALSEATQIPEEIAEE
jgi:DNA-directed RNA polymerase subunit M/transcription elongation factor TFIIS